MTTGSIRPARDRRTPADDFRQEGFAGARIADQHDVGAVVQKVEIQEAEDARFILLPGLVMLEQERIDRVLALGGLHPLLVLPVPAVVLGKL
jgi:hypothetical protein